MAETLNTTPAEAPAEAAAGALNGQASFENLGSQVPFDPSAAEAAKAAYEASHPDAVKDIGRARAEADAYNRYEDSARRQEAEAARADMDAYNGYEGTGPSPEEYIERAAIARKSGLAAAEEAGDKYDQQQSQPLVPPSPGTSWGSGTFGLGSTEEDYQ